MSDWSGRYCAWCDVATCEHQDAKLAAAEDMAAAIRWHLGHPGPHTVECPAEATDGAQCLCGLEALAAWRAAQGVVESGRDGTHEA